MARKRHQIGDLKATKEDALFVLSDPRAPRFKRFEAAIGWLDPRGEGHATQHALLVAGEQEDGRFNVIYETQGVLAAIIESAIDAKDRFLFKRIWIDDTEPELTPQLREADGLTHYVHYGEDREGRTIWANPKSRWKRFRSRETLCSVVPVPPPVQAHLLGGADRLERLNRQDKLLVHSRCVVASWCLDQQISEVLNHPVMKALIWLGWALEKTAPPVKQGRIAPVRYPNLKRTG